MRRDVRQPDDMIGAPGVTRTPGTQFRKLLLYPPELRGRVGLRGDRDGFYHFGPTGELTGAPDDALKALHCPAQTDAEHVGGDANRCADNDDLGELRRPAEAAVRMCSTYTERVACHRDDDSTSSVKRAVATLPLP